MENGTRSVVEGDDTAIERSRENIYEYRDIPAKRPHTPLTVTTQASQVGASQTSRPPSQASTGSALSLRDRDRDRDVSRAPEPLPRTRSRTLIVRGVPQTTV
ncbi:hypothetical protein ACJJTC_014303 [Scirpophaga incertulas]